MKKNTNNVIPVEFKINKALRSKRFNQNPKLIWFTGLSGSGKSTISERLEQKLFEDGYSTYALDGDNVRVGINKDLSFSSKDRQENIRRIAEISNLLLDAGLIICASFISPFEKDRALVKEIVGIENYLEIYLSTPLKTCEKRDVKGFYKKAREGKILEFTGVSSPYEVPKAPNLVIDTSELSIESAVNEIYKFVIKNI